MSEIHLELTIANIKPKSIQTSTLMGWFPTAKKRINTRKSPNLCSCLQSVLRHHALTAVAHFHHKDHLVGDANLLRSLGQGPHRLDLRVEAYLGQLDHLISLAERRQAQQHHVGLDGCFAQPPHVGGRCQTSSMTFTTA